MTRALLVVDVQNDFAEGGSLAVSGGAQVALDINQYIARSEEPYVIVIGSKDFHVDPGDHFANDPDYKDTWPVHCVANTKGSEFHPNLMADDHIEMVLVKGMMSAAYSAFEGITPVNFRSLDMIIDEFNITDLDVCGIATDYCVKATVLDARIRGLNVRLLADLCAAVDPDGTGKQALEQMEIAGVEVSLSANL